MSSCLICNCETTCIINIRGSVLSSELSKYVDDDELIRGSEPLIACLECAILLYNQQKAHPEAKIDMDQQRVEPETVQSPTRDESVHMDHDYDEKSQGTIAELINDDYQMTSDSLDNKEAFEPDNRADESEEASSDNQSTQSSSQLGGEVAGSSGNPQEVEHSETQSLPSSIEHRRIQMISDSYQVAPDSGIDQSQDTNQTVQDDQMSVDGIEASSSMLLLQQEGFPLIEVYLGEDPIEALQDAEFINDNDPAQFPGVLDPLEADAEEYIANELSAQFPGVLDPLKADQQASSESSPPSQETHLDATDTSPESSESAADVHQHPDIASSMVTLDEGKQIVSLPLTASTRKILKSFTSNVGRWKNRLRSKTLVNKKCNNAKETKLPPKSRSTSSSSSSCSVQEFRVRDRNEEIQAEKLPTTNANHSE